jgi:all-trans-retinol dehydrogenase (NAD+)
MKQQSGGHIVAISSMSAINPSPFAVEYSATKAAVNCYMKALGEKLRLQKMDGNIKTTCICPYYIKTRKDVIEFLNPR